jgi:hypothetical protein
MHKRTVIIDWQYSGKTDATTGTGAEQSERFLAYGFGFVLPLFYAYLYSSGKLDWEWWQYILAAIIGMDLGAGVVANALNSCKRFYHTPLKVDEPRYVGYLKQPLLFTSLHIYPLILAAVYPDGTWLYGIFWYALLVLSAWLVVKSPLYLSRPVAYGILLLAILTNYYLIQPPLGFEWLVPVLFIKIILAHLVREEPYRPSKMFIDTELG